jgi:hypothetical protein
VSDPSPNSVAGPSTPPPPADGAPGGGLFHELTPRQTLSVLALVAVLVLGVLAWRFHDKVEQQGKPAAACFVTGTGQQLCGSAAVAYCDIHEADYRANGDVDSINACEAARYGPDADVQIPPP